MLQAGLGARVLAAALLTPLLPFDSSRTLFPPVVLSLGLLCNQFGQITGAVSPGRE